MEQSGLRERRESGVIVHRQATAMGWLLLSNARCGEAARRWWWCGGCQDLVLLDANPLDAIGNTKTIRAVILNGRYLSRFALDKILHQAEAAATASH